MAGLIWFFKNVLQGDVSYLLLFVLSFLPTVYVWSENQRQTVAGKTEFAIEDIFHDRPTEFSSPLKMQAMYPKVDEGLLLISRGELCLERQKRAYKLQFTTTDWR